MYRDVFTAGSNIHPAATDGFLHYLKTVIVVFHILTEMEVVQP